MTLIKPVRLTAAPQNDQWTDRPLSQPDRDLVQCYHWIPVIAAGVTVIKLP